MKHITISPSIASADLLNLKDEIDFVDKHYGLIHIDIEDGNYIPNITFGKEMLKKIVETTKSVVSIHLMVNHPEQYLDCLTMPNIQEVFLHVDHIRYPMELLAQFRANGIDVGLAFNPRDSVASYCSLIRKCNHVMIMTSEPDGMDQQFQSQTISTIKSVRDLGDMKIWIDGGINQIAFKDIQSWPIDVVVLGRLVFQNKKSIIRV